MPFMCLPVGYLICRYSRMQGYVCSSPGQTGVLPPIHFLSLAPQWQPTEDGRNPRDGAVEHESPPAIQYAPGEDPQPPMHRTIITMRIVSLPLSMQITMLSRTATICSHLLIAMLRSTVTAARAVKGKQACCWCAKCMLRSVPWTHLAVQMPEASAQPSSAWLPGHQRSFYILHCPENSFSASNAFWWSHCTSAENTQSHNKGGGHAPSRGLQALNQRSCLSAAAAFAK